MVERTYCFRIVQITYAVESVRDRSTSDVERSYIDVNGLPLRLNCKKQ